MATRPALCPVIDLRRTALTAKKPALTTPRRHIIERWRPTAFSQSPLITAADLKKDWRKALTILPPWVRRWEEVHDDAVDYADDPAYAPLVVVIGRKDIRADGMVPLTLSLYAETTRFGGSIGTNSNHRGRKPQVYTRLAPPCSPPRLRMPALRYLADGLPGERIRSLWQRSDQSPLASYREPAARPQKRARQVVFECLAIAGEKRAPRGFDVAEWLGAIRGLFAMLDANTETLAE